MNALRNTCQALGIDYRTLLFSYHDSLGEDTLRLVRIFCKLRLRPLRFDPGPEGVADQGD